MELLHIVTFPTVISTINIATIIPPTVTAAMFQPLALRA